MVIIRVDRACFVGEGALTVNRTADRTVPYIFMVSWTIGDFNGVMPLKGVQSVTAGRDFWAPAFERP